MKTISLDQLREAVGKDAAIRRIVGLTGSLVLLAASVVLLYFGRGRDGGSLAANSNTTRDGTTSFRTAQGRMS